MTGPGSSEPLAVVLLAAGGSNRLGQPKQLVPVDGEALVLRTARRLLRLEPATMLVVTGCDSERVKEQLAGLPLQIVHNAEWKEGMGTSIACGVKNLPAGIEGVLIMLCDLWRVDLGDLKRLIEAWNTDISDIVTATWK
jgi:molybdenum cofactor cytidylyltransferase